MYLPWYSRSNLLTLGQIHFSGRCKFPVTYTDNKNLLQAVSGNKGISEKRLRRDINIIKQALEDDKIESIEWVATDEMLADPLTKKTANPHKLMTLIQRRM